MDYTRFASDPPVGAIRERSPLAPWCPFLPALFEAAAIAGVHFLDEPRHGVPLDGFHLLTLLTDGVCSRSF